jgi:putative ABC transport system ATP-binding protein
MQETIIKAEELTKVFRLPAEEIVAVDHVNLEIRKGDFVSLMGPSGSGKTTLLDLIGCLDSISSGRLAVFGEDVSNIKEDGLVGMRRGRIGFVFQEFLLLPELTAVENVEIPMTFARMSTDRGRALELLGKVGLGHRANHLPRELSGGERQRVAIARSLAASPNLLLADEPTGNLDTKNSREIFSVFEKLNREDGLTIVVATHDEGLGSQADRVVRLIDGRIVS